MVRSEAQKLRQKIKRPILVVKEMRVRWKGQKGQMKIFFFSVEEMVDFRVARRENGFKVSERDRPRRREQGAREGR